ncbi:MAG: class I SAM-dependent methyltransferase [Sedimentisphaerales bacterium]|nr:class I SAM-dependent methyltransferase [Sedimentisphaerales bacterium]
MFEELKKINERPKPFEFYTAGDLWTDEYISEQMLSFHLNGEVDLSSRNAEFIKRSVEWIESHFNIANKRIADFGCGPGLYTTKLAQRKATVTGIDFSKRSIQYAQDVANKEGLSINYVNQNYLEFETDDRFDLILMIMCDFCALSPSQRNAMLNKFYKILEPGGAILLDVYSLTAFEEREEASSYETNQLNGFWSPNDYYGFLNTFKYDTEKVVLDKYTIIEPARTRTIYNWLQYFSHDTLKMEFEECGFTVENLYSDVAGSPFDSKSKEFAIIARKL